MKLKEDITANVVRMSQVQDSCSFDIDNEMKAHVFRMLREGIYSDAKAACIREYICNAIDSNVQAGKKASEVIITLPTRFQSELVIKDVGVGLSHEDVHNVFRFYGSSTKRDSNDVVGCLGIGSKAAFSYTDTFTIVARKDGYERIYSATISRSSDDEAGQGLIHKLAERQTTDSNGVEIKIPIKQTDVHAFYHALSNFLSFFPKNERPTVTNSDFQVIEREYNFHCGPCSMFIDNAYYRNSKGSFAIMGNIPYRIDKTKLKEFDYPIFDENNQPKKDARGKILTEKVNFTSEELTVFNMGVDIRFEIGELDFAISREELRYKYQTLMNLKIRANQIIEELTKRLSNKLNNCKNLWEARMACFKITKGTNNDLDNIIYRQIFSKKISLEWNGQVIVPECPQLPKGDETDSSDYWYCEKVDGYANRGRVVGMLLEENPRIIIADQSRYRELQKVATALEKNNWNSCYLFRFPSQEAQDAWIKEAGLENHKLYKLSEFHCKNVLTKTSKHAKTSMFAIDDKFFNSNSSMHSRTWNPEEIDLDNLNHTVYYVDIYRYRPVFANQQNAISTSTFMELVRFLKSKHVISKLYGFKQKARIEILKHPNGKKFFVNVLDLFKEELDKVEKNCVQFSKCSANERELYSTHYEVPGIEKEEKIVKQLSELKPSNLFRKVLEAKWEMLDAIEKSKDGKDKLQINKVTSLIQSLRWSKKYPNITSINAGNDTGNPDHNLSKLFNLAKKQFPMLKYVNNYSYVDRSVSMIKTDILDYIKEKE